MNERDNEKRFTFAVEGMTCASCVRIVERGLKKMQGVHFVSLNLATEKAYVITDRDVDFNDIQKAVEKTGYRAAEAVKGDEKAEADFNSAFKRMLAALSVMVPLSVLMLFHMSGMHMPWFVYLETAAGAAVFVFPARGIFRSAWIAAFHGHANMDSLVAMGAAASWITSPLSASGLDIASFGSLSVMITGLHLTGRYIEARLRYRASGDIRALLSLRPSEASVLSGEGEVPLPVDAVLPGMTVVVRSGERIPLDGEIADGSGYVDESMITGEPGRVFRKEGDRVTGGTVLENGFISAVVLSSGEDSFLARMIRLVEDAQSSRVPIQAFADRVTGLFVPIVFLTASFSGIFWWLNYDSMVPLLQKASAFIPWVNPEAGAGSTAVFVFTAVLVIACPCALGLATPMALITGSGLAASKGLLLKNGEVIQKSGELEYIFLDKTGTITAGRPSVVSTDLDIEGLEAALVLESASLHPIAEAVKIYCSERGITGGEGAENVREIPGRGVSGTFRRRSYEIGRPADPSVYCEMMERGETVVELSSGGNVLGFISVADPVKAGSAEAVAALKEAGIITVMLTGDNEVTARAVAGMTGIEHIIAGAAPHEKLYAVQDRQKEDRVVAMVGDGINDAAALRAADIGIALGTGTDLSIESADIVITNDTLMSVPAAIGISGLTFRKIRQNLFGAFFYNAAALPAAVMGMLHPAVAEICMILSSVSVILNSISIKRNKHREDMR